MLDSVVRILEDYEPTISSLVGLLTLCAAIWGVLRLRVSSRKKPAPAPARDRQSAGIQRVGWQSIFNLGLSEHSRIEELVSVRTVNVVLFCLLVISFPWLLICLFFGKTIALTLLNLCVFSGALLGFALQRAGATGAARWLVLGVVNLYWLGAMLVIGANQGTEYFLAGLMSLPVLMLSRAQSAQRLLSLVFILGVFTVGVVATQNRVSSGELNETILLIGYHANALFLAIVIFAALSYYKKFAANSYQMLSSKKREHDALVAKLIPSDIAVKMVNKEDIAARWHPEATVLVATVTGLAKLYTRLPAIDLVSKLDDLYSGFDELVDAHGVEKIKTLGTTYVAVSGLDHASDSYAAVASLALAMRDGVEAFAQRSGLPIGFRCGIATGLTISGVIGKSRPRFDIWGEALDGASALESIAGENAIVLDETTYWRLDQRFECTPVQTAESAFALLAKREIDELAS